MIKITSPIPDTLIYTNKVYVDYEVTENSKFTEKVVFFVDSTKYERIDLKGRLEATNLAEGKHTLRAYLVNKYNKKIVGSETTIYFYTNDDVISIKNKISTIISSQIPDFIKNDYDKFVKFIEYYYAYLEQSNDPKLVPLSSYDFSDVDITPEFFINKFKNQFIPDFPTEFTYDLETGKPLNLKTLIKRASEFYRSKGTQNSFDFIFKILFDQDIQFYYPRQHMFIVSGAKWLEKKSIKFIVPPRDERPRNFVGNIVYQTSDNGQIVATARVLSCSLYKQSPFDVAELELAEISGQFVSQYQVSCDIVIQDAEETVSYYPSIGVDDIAVVNGGFNYKAGDRIELIPIQGQRAEGVGYVGRVSQVNSRGEIVKIVAVNFGVNYEENLTGKYTISIRSDSGTGFSGLASSSVLCGYEGKYTSSSGVLSDRSFIQDNYYYQTHSYEIVSSIPFSQYYDVVKRIVHPAGYKMFGSQVVQQRIIIDPKQQDYSTGLTSISSYYIGNYIAYRINGEINLRDAVLSGIPNTDLFPTGVNILQEIPPDSDGYFVHNSLGLPEKRNINDAFFENYSQISTLIPDWDQRYIYWVVFPHPSFLINNTNSSMNEFYNLQIQDLAVVEEVTI